MPSATFDFEGFKRAFTSQDIDAWAAFFAEDGEWIEYRQKDPPRAPHVMRGRAQIAEHLRRVKASNVRLSITDEVLGPTRAAFCVWIVLPDNVRRIVENVIIHYRDGRITRQVDVEAWDF